jgi:hypothetical protein
MASDFSPAEVALLRRQMDETAVLGTLRRYLFGVDRPDFEIIASCFTEDVEWGGNGLDFKGREALVGAVRKIQGQFKWTYHILGPSNVAVDGDTATIDAYVLAIIVEPGGAATGHYRGANHYEELVRAGDGWQIKKMIIQTEWETQAPSTGVSHFAQAAIKE